MTGLKVEDMSKTHKFRRGEHDNIIDRKYTYTLFLPLYALDDEYTDDELTLESYDGEYKQTRILGTDGEIVDDYWIRVTWTEVKPRKNYRCIHDLKKTSTGESGVFVLFEYVLLTETRFNKPNIADIELTEEERGEFGVDLDDLRSEEFNHVEFLDDNDEDLAEEPNGKEDLDENESWKDEEDMDEGFGRLNEGDGDEEYDGDSWFQQLYEDDSEQTQGNEGKLNETVENLIGTLELKNARRAKEEAGSSSPSA